MSFSKVQLYFIVKRQGDCSKVAHSFARTTCVKPQIQQGIGLRPIAKKQNTTVEKLVLDLSDFLLHIIFNKGNCFVVSVC
jgi:hypothetical protein